MKMLKALIIASLTSTMALAEVKIKSIDLDATGDKVATMKISYSGELTTTPELNVGKDHVQVVLNGATVWPKIEKKAHLASSNDSTVMAYQFDKGLVRARAIIPMNLMGQENAIKVRQTPGKIEVIFPKSAAASTAATNTNKDQYDESYLETLSQEKKAANTAATVTTTAAVKVPAETFTNLANKVKDEVKTTQAAPATEE